MKNHDEAPVRKRARTSGQVAAAKALRTTGTVLLSTILIGIIISCVIVSVMTVYVLRHLEQDNGIDIRTIKLSYTSILYAQDKATGDYMELQRIHSDENRIWVDIANIPKVMQDATIAAEDERFETHRGVDWKRTFASGINLVAKKVGIDIYKGTPGGSTIDQQLIKNITQDDDVSPERKVREIFRALQMERNYSKDEIMEAYLNTIGLSNNTNGVQAAANLYFNKDVSEITAAEAASIIAITKSPTSNNPFKNPDNNKIRRDWILKNMHELGKLTDSEYEQAQTESDNMVFASESAPAKLNTDQNWFVDAVIDNVIKDLVEKKKYTEATAKNLIFRGGYRIYTTVDTEMQSYLEAKYKDDKTFPSIRNKTYPQSAFVITDLNGKVLALVGGRGEKEGNRLFNRATSAKRHPGSTIKPVGPYAMAFENDLITWSTLINDQYVKLEKGEPWPKNYYGHYKGPITVEEAIQRSTNTIPVQLTQVLTPNVIFSFLKNDLQVDSLIERKQKANGGIASDIDLGPMSLGSLTEGITPLEWAGAYQIMGNGGTFTKPYLYTKVLDAQGNVVLENIPEPTRVISFESATIINKLMQRVTTGQYGTGTRSKFSAMPVAGKTGTSTGDKDQWFVGITPYYIGVTWMGYDEPDTIDYRGFTYPPPVLWKNVMADLHKNLPVKDFVASSKVISKNYCLRSGQLATPDCESTAVGWYKEDHLPEECEICTGWLEQQEVVPSWSPSMNVETDPDSESSSSSDSD